MIQMIICVGASHWVRPPTRAIRVADTNMFVSKKPCGPNAKAYGPNASPNMSQWNMVSHWVGESWVCIGHVDFMLFVLISFTFSGGIWALYNRKSHVLTKQRVD